MATNDSETRTLLTTMVKACTIPIQTVGTVFWKVVSQLVSPHPHEGEHLVYKQIDNLLGQKSTVEPSIVQSIEQISLYSNQADALFDFFAKELGLPIVYDYQPISQQENYPFEQSTRSGCVFMNNFKIQCVEQPALNQLRSYLSGLFTFLFGERLVGRKPNQLEQERDDSRVVNKLLNPISEWTQFLSSSEGIHTFALLGITLKHSLKSEKKTLRSRNVIFTNQMQNFHKFYMSKSMLARIKMQCQENVHAFSQTFLFGSIWEFYRKFLYKNEPFKNHGIYILRQSSSYDLILKLVSDKYVKYVKNRGNWSMKLTPLGSLKIKSCKEIEFQTTAIREDIEGLQTFIKLFGSKNVETIEPYRHYLWNFDDQSKLSKPVPPKLRVICRDRSEIYETNRVFGISKIVLEVQSLDDCQYYLSSKGIPFKLQTSTIIIQHPLLQTIQINLVE